MHSGRVISKALRMVVLLVKGFQKRNQYSYMEALKEELAVPTKKGILIYCSGLA
jgi:hypothetical protein